MYYEEQVRNGVLCYRSTPDGEWAPMSAERLTAMLLELRQRQVATPPVFVPQPPWAPPWTITC